MTDLLVQTMEVAPPGLLRLIKLTATIQFADEIIIAGRPLNSTLIAPAMNPIFEIKQGHLLPPGRSVFISSGLRRELWISQNCGRYGAKF